MTADLFASDAFDLAMAESVGRLRLSWMNPRKIKGTLLYSRRDATHTRATTADDGTISLIAKKHEFVIEKKTDTSHGEGFFLRP